PNISPPRSEGVDRFRLIFLPGIRYNEGRSSPRLTPSLVAMSSLSPPAGLVRPRVTVQGTGDPLPLGDLLADILAEGKHPIVWIVGGPGSGKTTALEYLAGMFGNESLLLLDEPKEIPESDRPVVATASRQIAAERVKCRHELGGVF